MIPPIVALRLATYPDRRTVPLLEQLWRDAIARDERRRRRLERINIKHWTESIERETP